MAFATQRTRATGQAEGLQEVEAKDNGDNNNLQSQFSHKLNGQVDWIESRSQQKYYPAGGNSYSPVGVRKVRVSLASSNTNSFIEPSSVMFQFKNQ